MLKTDFIKTIQSFISDGKTDEALSLLHQEVAANYPNLFNDVTLIENRYKNAHDDFFIKGILTKDDFDKSVAKINVAILDVMSKINPDNQTTKPTTVQKNTGRLLHNIPEQMPLQKESKCVVRIAYDEDVIKRDLPVSIDTVIQTIKITEVMSVNLVDFNETPCFTIRTITEAEQFIDDGDYTQWLFMVKPLKPGHYPLTLKVTVMEKIDGKERKRDIVLEKEIYIQTQVNENANQSTTENIFTDTKVVLTGLNENISGKSPQIPDKDKNKPTNGVPQAPSPSTVSEAAPNYSVPVGVNSPSVKPDIESAAQVIAPKSNRNLATMITSALALLLVAGVGLWVTNKSGLSDNKPAVVTTDSSAQVKKDFPKPEDHPQGEIAQNFPNDNNGKGNDATTKTNPAAPPVPTKITKKKPNPDNEVIADAEKNNKGKSFPTVSKPAKRKPTNPTAGTEPEIEAMKTENQQIENLPDIAYAKPTVIPPDRVWRTTIPANKQLRQLTIQINNSQKLKDAQFFVDGLLVQPNLNLKNEPVSLSIISHIGPHTILMKKGNKSCEYPDVLMVSDITAIEGCNLD